MKKVILTLFSVLFTCTLSTIGYGNDFATKHEIFTNNVRENMQNLTASNTAKIAELKQKSQDKINQFRSKSDNEIAELKQKSAQEFAKLEKQYNDFIKDTPFENCVPGWSYLECKQLNGTQTSTWSCSLKPGITSDKMISDVESYCAKNGVKKSINYDPMESYTPGPQLVTASIAHDPVNTDNISSIVAATPTEKKAWENPDNPVDITPDTETSTTDITDKSASTLLSSQSTPSKQPIVKNNTDKKNSMLKNAFEKYCDSEGYTPPENSPGADLPGIAHGTYKEQCSDDNPKVTITCYKKKKNVTYDAKDLQNFCFQGKTNSFELSHNTADRPENQIKDCNATEKKKIDALSCKISVDGKYSDIKCDETKNMEEQNGKCKKHSDLINIIGEIIDSETKNPINWVHIQYDEGKKNPGQMRTGSNGLFNIDVIPGTNVIFTHNNYITLTTTFNDAGKPDPIKMTPKTSEYLRFEGVVMDEDKIIPIPNATLKYNNKKTKTDENGKFDIKVPKDTIITFQATDYEDREWKLEFEGTQVIEIPMKRTEKKQINDSLLALCNKNGKWNETLDKCNCNKGYFFDETNGCVTSTTDYQESSEKLDTLYNQFKNQLQQSNEI